MRPLKRHSSRPALNGCVLAIVCLGTTLLEGRAAVTNYTSLATFQLAVGLQSRIGFTEVSLGTTPMDEYAGFGVRFLDGNNETEADPGAYLTDGVGLAGCCRKRRTG